MLEENSPKSKKRKGEKMEILTNAVSSLSTLVMSFAGKVILALVVWVIGKYLIKKVLKMLNKNKKFQDLEGTVKSFAQSFVKIGLYALLLISIIGILGVETASIITALASAGVAVGLALQGALSNLAGGIMLVIFKPFRQGDYIDAAGESGVVSEVTLFYTVLTTLDNKRVTIPNGTLMNANVVDYSAEEFRRVDLAFSCAKSENPSKISELMLAEIATCDKVLDKPDAPFARVCGGTNESMDFAVRVWVKNEDYWDVYFELTQKITEAFGKAGVQAPTVRVDAGK